MQRRRRNANLGREIGDAALGIDEAVGGDGEARTVFMRNARNYADEGGYAGFEVVRYEEGIESTRPFARRYASGEIRLARGSR